MEYIDKLMFSIPLKKIYKVEESLRYNEEAEFCAVVVKVKNEFLQFKVDNQANASDRD